MPLILGTKRRGDADYLDTCLSKRNIVEYDRTGAVSAGEAQELLAFVAELRDDVRRWFEERHAELV